MLRVLVVDDDAAIRGLFVALLRRVDVTVECASDGRVALELLALGSYDLIFLDLMMPRVNGFEVLDYLRLEKPSLLATVVVTTGIAERQLNRLDSEGVRGVLRKPFDIEQVVEHALACRRNAAEV